MEYLDTTIPKSEFNKEFRNHYDSYYFSLRKEYLNIIDVNFYKKINLDLLVSSVSEKNISSSYIFHNICLYYSIKKFLSKRTIETIYVENTFLKKNIEPFYAGTINIRNNKKIPKINIFRILLNQFLIFFISKFISKDKKIKSKINLVDIFITSNNLKIDRYYDNFFLNKKLFYYIPTFVNLSIIKIISCLLYFNKKNYILKSQFMTFKDFLYSINFTFRVDKIKIENIFFRKLNIKDLILRELYLRQNLNASIIGLQNYFFAKNLKDKKIELKSVLNWSENSIVDKGWNYGFRSSYESLNTFGYQGYYVEKKLSSIDITSNEFKSKTCPEYIMIVGSILKKSRSEFVKKIKFIQSRAFRFEHLLLKKFYKKKINNKIIILLNLDKETCIEIIDKIRKTKFAKNNKTVFIKEHPLLRLSQFYKKSLPNNFKIIEGNFYDIIKKFKVIITSGSSSSVYESLLSGGKIIFPINDYYDNLNLEMLDVPKSYYKVCSNIDELDSHINKFLHQDIKYFKYYRNKNRLKKSINDTKNLNFLEKN
ncbi:hypothetical protein N9T18_00060 [Candidatus Pelagibacter sp.]|jgi:hypothetical protein|nr:hypothetical protein [Candidatus Pelagibacter sp.]